MLVWHLRQAKLERAGKSNDARYVECSAAQPSFVPSTCDQGIQPHRWTRASYVKRSDTFGSIDLVGREAHQVHAERCDIYRQLADALCRIAVKQRAALMAKPRDFSDRL